MTLTLSDQFAQTPASFPVHEVPVYDSIGTQLEGYKRIINGRSGKMLSILRDSYTLIPNERLLSVAEAIAGTRDNVQIDSGFAIDGGKITVLNLSLGGFDIGGYDPHIRRITVANSHDGSRAFSVWDGVIRLACRNAFYRSERAATGIIRVSHRSAATLQLDTLEAYLRSVDAAHDDWTEVARKASGVILTDGELYRLAERWAEMIVGARPWEPDAAAQWDSRRCDIASKILRSPHGTGNESAYDLWNRFTGYLQWERGHEGTRVKRGNLGDTLDNRRKQTAWRDVQELIGA